MKEDEETCYTFIIQTGASIPEKEQTKKWDDGAMMITINPGSNHPSPEVKVVKHFPMETEGAVTADFWLPASIGEPKLLKVDLESNKLEMIKDALFVRQITVMYNRRPYRFPVKNYLYPHNPMAGNPSHPEMGCPPHFLIREGAGTLRHRETEEYIIKARDEDMDTIKSMVFWRKSKENKSEVLFPNFLGILDYSKLPRFLKFKEAQQKAFEGLRKPVREKIKHNALENFVDKMFATYELERCESFEEFADFVKETYSQMDWAKEAALESLKIAKVFRNDEEFGRQMLCGPNAFQISKVSLMQGRWADSEVPAYALEGRTVKDVIEAGHLFEITSDDLIGVPHGGKFSKELTGTKQKWYVVLADCLLYQRNDGKVVPVQIRLENRNDGEPATFWAPPDPQLTNTDHPQHLAWLYAKMWFRCADTNIQIFCKHFARAHATNEVLAVAVYRNLPSAHPIFRLLQPHIQGIIPINVQARSVLINPGRNVLSSYTAVGDHYTKIFTNHYKDFSYLNMVIPYEIQRRGVGEIPGYVLRDDILSYWNILYRYTSNMVNLAYPANEDVAKDTELQSVLTDVVDVGFRGFPNGAGFPRCITEKEKLAEYLTAIIVNISVFHSAVNFQTFTYYSFAPNSPTCMSKPPPKQGEEITMKRILKSLPVKEISFICMAVCYVLGRYSPIERFYLGSSSENKLGILGENMAITPEQEECIHQMCEDMRVLQRRIDLRNEGQYLKYDVMSPANTPIMAQI